MPRGHSRGFTLLELMVVVAIIAMATAAVTFALRDDSGTRLEREALRLSAMLESARTGSPVSIDLEQSLRGEVAGPSRL